MYQRGDRMDQQDRVENSRICVVGAGSVGLPLSVAFDGAGHDVITYDVDRSKIDRLASGNDPTNDVGERAVTDSAIEFTVDETRIEVAEYVIVAVPTPVDDLKQPDLEYVIQSGETIGHHLQEGACVVLESTVYPGATREILAPAIERTSGMTAGEGFFVGYSPERLVPGDDERGVADVVKVVSGDPEIRDELVALYGTVVDAGVHVAPEIEVAEAAKCIENIQRDLNIALVNELAIACTKLGIDTHAVLEAAGTKWNFHEYRPGLVGGHCIPVDPFFMIYQSKRNGFDPELIEKGREVNDYMPVHVGNVILKELNRHEKVLSASTVLVLGMAYKPNVGDIRTSAVGGLVNTLEEFDVDVVGYEPNADSEVVRKVFDIPVQRDLSFEGVDAAVLAAPHDELRTIEYEDVAHEMAADPILIDVEGALDSERLETSERLHYRRI